MSNTYLQGNQQGYGNSSTTVTLQFSTQNVAAGSLLVAAVAIENSNAATVTVSDDQNGTWSQAGSYTTAVSTNRRLGIFYFPNSKGGVKPTVSIARSTSLYMGVCIAEYSVNQPASVSVDNCQNQVTSSNATSLSTGTITVSGTTDELIVAAIAQGSAIASTYTASPASFTVRQSQLNGSVFEGCGLASDENASASEACTLGVTGLNAGQLLVIGVSFNTGSSNNTWNEPETILNGGSIIGGSATLFLVSSRTATGGIVVGGTASDPETNTPALSGGTVLGGSATLAVISSRTATGGVLVGSAASITVVYATAASGGSLAGGTIGNRQISTIVATGGALADGMATLAYVPGTRPQVHFTTTLVIATPLTTTSVLSVS